MVERLNFAVVVRDHILTFYNYRQRVETPGSSKLNGFEIVVHLGIPAVVTIALWRAGVTLPESSIGSLITALAVFGALLFNLLILVYDVSGRPVGDVLEEVRAARKATLRDLHSNVAFAVLLTVLSIIDLVLAAVGEKGAVVQPTSLVFYYLGSLFVLTLLIILRRMHMLLSSDIARR
jgi:hypothetical protein